MPRNFSRQLLVAIFLTAVTGSLASDFWPVEYSFEETYVGEASVTRGPHLNPLPDPLLCPRCRLRVHLSQRERQGEEDTGRGCLGNQGGRPYAKRQVRVDMRMTIMLGVGRVSCEPEVAPSRNLHPSYLGDCGKRQSEGNCWSRFS